MGYYGWDEPDDGRDQDAIERIAAAMRAAPEEQWELIYDVVESTDAEPLARVITDLLTVLKREDWQTCDAMGRLFDAAREFERQVLDRIDDAAVAAYDEECRKSRDDADEARAESREFDWEYGP